MSRPDVVVRGVDDRLQVRKSQSRLAQTQPKVGPLAVVRVGNAIEEIGDIVDACGGKEVRMGGEVEGREPGVFGGRPIRDVLRLQLGKNRLGLV